MTAVSVYSRLLMRAADAAREMQFELDTKWLVKGDIDEVAILFKNPSELAGFVNFCRTHGIDHFNTVERDTMFTAITGQAFDVRFEFLQIPGTPFRIEAMCVLAGEAPLHEPLHNHSIVHASFKCLDYAHYLHTLAVMGHLLPERLEYRNSYGRFAYFGAYPPYFKPRINLRDRQSAQNVG